MTSSPKPFVRATLAAFVLQASLDLARAERDAAEIDSSKPAYRILLDEQRQALSSNSTPKFASLVEDFLAFRFEAIRILKSRYAGRFREGELKRLSTALLEYGKDQSGMPSQGSPVFHNFHGHWRGRWYQDGAWTWYDHTWDEPRQDGDLIVQYVEIGEWDGSRRIRPIPAINVYNPSNGQIAGAVGLANDPAEGTDAPHWGIYLDNRTLIWIARFGPRSESPYYSIYFEQILGREPAEYRIQGIGFNWDDSTESGRIVEPHWKEGRYWRAQDLEDNPHLAPAAPPTEN